VVAHHENEAFSADCAQAAPNNLEKCLVSACRVNLHDTITGAKGEQSRRRAARRTRHRLGSSWILAWLVGSLHASALPGPGEMRSPPRMSRAGRRAKLVQQACGAARCGQDAKPRREDSRGAEREGRARRRLGFLPAGCGMHAKVFARQPRMPTAQSAQGMSPAGLRPISFKTRAATR